MVFAVRWGGVIPSGLHMWRAGCHIASFVKVTGNSFPRVERAYLGRVARVQATVWAIWLNVTHFTALVAGAAPSVLVERSGGGATVAEGLRAWGRRCACAATLEEAASGGRLRRSRGANWSRHWSLSWWLRSRRTCTPPKDPRHRIFIIRTNIFSKTITS